VLHRKSGIQCPERLGPFVKAVCDNVLLEFFRARSLDRREPDCPREHPSTAISVEAALISEQRHALMRHGGVMMGVYDNCGHAFKGLDGFVSHYFDFSDIIRNVSAVTGACLMTKWSKLIAHDPFYSPNLTRNDENYSPEPEPNPISLGVRIRSLVLISGL
jgi:hypothetical protein